MYFIEVGVYLKSTRVVREHKTKLLPYKLRELTKNASISKRVFNYMLVAQNYFILMLASSFQVWSCIINKPCMF